MKRLFFCVAALLLILMACYVKPGEKAVAKDVAFEVASGYFFRNDRPVPAAPLVMTSQAELENYFGYATTMSSRPTAIDFTQQAALAIVEAPTQRHTDIEVTAIRRPTPDTLTVNYRVSVGDSLTYTLQPVTLVLIPRTDLFPTTASTANPQLPAVVAREE
ncbi:MAG: hypothetical protein HUK02_04945 [Bacteroidaceae bacterium]|nr:hypothetical protein [Bacteroidaceae bacterium]